MEPKMYADRNCEEGHHGFKMFLPLLIVPVVFGMMRGMARHKFGHMRAMYGAQGENFVPPMFAELHRRAHAAETQAQGAAPAPTQPPAAPV
jgi:hypothetical protein